MLELFGCGTSSNSPRGSSARLRSAYRTSSRNGGPVHSTATTEHSFVSGRGTGGNRMASLSVRSAPGRPMGAAGRNGDLIRKKSNQLSICDADSSLSYIRYGSIRISRQSK